MIIIDEHSGKVFFQFNPTKLPDISPFQKKCWNYNIHPDACSKTILLPHDAMNRAIYHEEMCTSDYVQNLIASLRQTNGLVRGTFPFIQYEKNNVFTALGYAVLNPPCHIKLAKDQHIQSKTFTCAHEIAHIFLHTTKLVIGPQDKDYWPVEIVCDLIAECMIENYHLYIPCGNQLRRISKELISLNLA